MERMGKKAICKHPMGKHESGMVKRKGEAGMKDLRGMKEFKGVTMKGSAKKK